jgi:hypothetical protein
MSDMETMKMKTTLFLSTITASLFAASVTFAQNFVMMPQTQGETSAALQGSEHAAPYDRFTRSDLDYHGRVIVPRHNIRSPAAGIGEPAPGQEND